MTEEEPDQIVNLAHPTQCVLWEHPERLEGKLADLFDTVETYQDGNHLTRTLYKCRECGQRYFYEWYEWVDWEDGNDRSYVILVPVQTQDDIDALKKTDVFSLMRYFPPIQWDFGSPAWNGKDSGAA
jgi:hypothetical protein